MAIDPVCGVTVDKEIASAGYSYQGHIYYFSGQDCRDKFAEAREKVSQDFGLHFIEFSKKSGKKIADVIRLLSGSVSLSRE